MSDVPTASAEPPGHTVDSHPEPPTLWTLLRESHEVARECRTRMLGLEIRFRSEIPPVAARAVEVAEKALSEASSLVPVDYGPGIEIPSLVESGKAVARICAEISNSARAIDETGGVPSTAVDHLEFNGRQLVDAVKDFVTAPIQIEMTSVSAMRPKRHVMLFRACAERPTNEMGQQRQHPCAA